MDNIYIEKKVLVGICGGFHSSAVCMLLLDALTPGQSALLYKGAKVIRGGIIENHKKIIKY